MKKASKMTDKELVEAWDKGKIWIRRIDMDEKLWHAGLKRIEEIEDEMKKRKIGVWKK